MKSRTFPLSLLLCGLLCQSAWAAQVLSNPDQATVNRLGLVFERVQPVAATNGTTVSARVMSSPLQPDAVVTRFSGVVEEWRVAPGEQVEAGAILGLLRSSEVLSLQQQWLQANAALQQASAARTRDQQLLNDGVIAAQRMQQTERDYQAARAAADALSEQMTLAGIDAQMRASFTSSSPELGLYILRAPVAGVVGRVQAIVGEAVNTAQRVVELSAARLWIEADLPAMLATALEEDQSLSVAGIDTPLILRQLDHQLDPRTQTLRIRAEFAGEAALRPGQIVPLLLRPNGGGWRIPADAVVHNGGSTEVFVRGANGIESRTLNLLPLGADYLAREGVNGDEQVIVRGAALLKGMTLGLGGE
ncbi:MAG: efflux RND transporter periplasmic adaptor subunit [Pseudomonadales bacterium]|jgi:cobalt-zinc-cadmium efflux system membrane fusion protein|nr:efflux RND transporter periplasmic adaptor subunit [Pseudomonadales bacterium]